MKKIIAMLAALTMVLSMAACGNTQPETTEGTTTAPTTQATEAPTTEATEDTTEPSSDVLANFIQLSISEEDGTIVSLTAYDDEEGGVYVEYVGAVKKVGTLDKTTLAGLTNVLTTSGFAAMNGTEEYGDGFAYASVYCSYTDESMLSVNYGGEIPQTFRDAYAIVDEYFQDLVKDLPEYVPSPEVMGDVNSDILDALNGLLTESGAEPLDAFSITDVPVDGDFAAAMGLSKNDGIVSGAACGPMMTSVAFSCNVVLVENEGDVASVVADFAANVDWDRWICVSASDALVATKGNLVLCLAGAEDLYQMFAGAVETAGWTVVETLVNK